MRRLLECLAKELFGFKLILFIVGCITFELLYAYTAYTIFSLLGVDFSSREINKKIPISEWYSPIILATLAIYEEALFRLPLAAAAMKWGKSWLIIMAAALISIFFGYLHGGFSFILIQGVGGFILSIIFLKAGGFNGKIIKPLIASSTAHLLYNGVIVVSIIIRGGKYI
jgi:membrane protease YdiL (CAAX protease family)